jgi:hypothetical protein
MPTLKGEFELAGWDETTYADLEGERKLNRASVRQNITGDVAGTGEVEYLMCYGEDGTARFLGFQRIEGTAGGRDGSFVVESVGGFAEGKATGTWSVVPGSGTGDLTGLSGSGSFEAETGPKGSYELDADFG